jgi:hypothetical protein
MAPIAGRPHLAQATTCEAAIPHHGRNARGATRSPFGVLAIAALALVASLATLNARAGAQMCVGDCNGDGTVEVNELIVGVNIALGVLAIAQCPSLDNGDGSVPVDRLVLAVTNALDGCAISTPGEDTPTPTETPIAGTPSPMETPTSGASVSMWTVDNYEVVESDCGEVVKESVNSAVQGLGPDFTVQQSGDQVEIDGSHGVAFRGTIDPDGTVHVQRRLSGSVATCDYNVDITASANLSTSPATATYLGAVGFSGFCLEFSDCSVQITARWTRVDG